MDLKLLFKTFICILINHIISEFTTIIVFLKKYIKDSASYINDVENLLMKAGGSGKLKKTQSDKVGN